MGFRVPWAGGVLTKGFFRVIQGLNGGYRDINDTKGSGLEL